jgi:integrase
VILRGRIYYIRYYDNRGRRRLETTKSTDKAEAEKQLRKRLSAKDAGIDGDAAAGRLTIKEALDDVLNDLLVNQRRSRANVKANIDNYLLKWFGERRKVANVTTSTIRAYTAERLKLGYKAATINRELAILRRAFRLAVKAGRLVQAPYVELLAEKNARKGFIDADAVAAICEHLPAYAAAPVKFAFLTGWRLRSEVLPLTWAQVDWKGRQVRLEPGTTKNDEGRTFPFTAALETVLKAQLAVHEAYKTKKQIVPFVFPFTFEDHERDGEQQQSIRKVWMTACKEAGYEGRVIHDLRRSAVRTLERASVPRSTAMALVGHKTESIYRRYAIQDEAMLREGAAKLDAYLPALPEPTPPATGMVKTFTPKATTKRRKSA